MGISPRWWIWLGVSGVYVNSFTVDEWDIVNTSLLQLEGRFIPTKSTRKNWGSWMLLYKKQLSWNNISLEVVATFSPSHWMIVIRRHHESISNMRSLATCFSRYSITTSSPPTTTCDMSITKHSDWGHSKVVHYDCYCVSCIQWWITSLANFF